MYDIDLLEFVSDAATATGALARPSSRRGIRFIYFYYFFYPIYIYIIILCAYYYKTVRQR